MFFPILTTTRTLICRATGAEYSCDAGALPTQLAMVQNRKLESTWTVTALIGTWQERLSQIP
jgi:hypothetical protein